jgi:hypothetical protein
MSSPQLIHRSQSITTQFAENEFIEEGAVKFARLARGRSPVDSLGVATKGELVPRQA